MTQAPMAHRRRRVNAQSQHHGIKLRNDGADRADHDGRRHIARIDQEGVAGGVHCLVEVRRQGRASAHVGSTFGDQIQNDRS